MNPVDLVQRLTEVLPHLDAAEQLRFALIIAMDASADEDLTSREGLLERCNRVAAKISVTSDQHAAVSCEIDGLASQSPCEFSPDHLWTLVRAIKVQSQILDMYLGVSESPA